MLAVQSCVTGGSDPSLSGLYMSRDKCWLCSCPRTSNSHKNYSKNLDMFIVPNDSVNAILMNQSC